MAIAGIIAEFDPFHNGHKHLIDTVRRALAPRAVVCVMSGQFTQRGEPAVLDKFTRAELAVRCGADLVAELPVSCAVNAAREFAFGGVSTLGLLGVCTHLAFGSETADLALLEGAAQAALEEGGAFREELRRQLESGKPYGTAYALALKASAAPLTADLSGFPGSNDILALEYIKQLKTGDFGMSALAVRREGAGHRQAEAGAQGSGFASGQAIRELLRQKDPDAAAPYVPGCTLNALRSARDLSQMQAEMFAILRYTLTQKSPEEIACAPGVSEGLENVILREIRGASDYEDLIARVRSRRYPRGRVCRVLAQLLLGIERQHLEDLQSQPAYVRVLAFNETGAGLISEARKMQKARIIVNPGREEWDPSGMPSNLKLDMRASEVYGMLSGRSPYDSSDFVNIPKLFRI